MENEPSTVEVDFVLSVGPGRLKMSAHVSAGKVTLTQLLPVLQSLTSNIIDSTVCIVEAEGHRVSCKVGCGACCRQMIPLNLFEAEALAEWIRTLSNTQQEELQRRFHHALLALREAGILARMDPHMWVEGSDEAKTLAIDYLAQKIPCPFLQDESCSIHPIRPAICREYLVTSPAEYCADPSEHPVVGVPIPVKMSTTLFKLGAAVDHDTRGWIPLVFLFAWMQSGARPGDSIAGPGPDLLHSFIQELAKGSDPSPA